MPGSPSPDSRASQRRPPEPAGTSVVNVASASYDGAGAPVSSNPATLRIDELLGIALSTTATVAPVAAGAETSVAVLLTNQGNGNEAFVLQASVAGGTATVLGFALDRNGNGVFDPGIDTLIANGDATALLAPGQAVTLLVRLQGDDAATGALTVSARAVTGSGTPGTLFAGQGDGGGDAVVGPTTAAASLSLPLRTARADAAAALVKSQSVRAPDGSDSPVPGAIITYSIEARFTGTGAANDARIADPVPEGTDYVPASLTLDGAALSDAADGDAGTLGDGTVAVALGNVAAPAAHTVSFQVKIK